MSHKGVVSIPLTEVSVTTPESLLSYSTKGYCCIEGTDSEKIKDVKIFNLSGKIEREFFNNKFDISNMEKGIYLVQVNTESTCCSLKLVKE